MPQGCNISKFSCTYSTTHVQKMQEKQRKEGTEGTEKRKKEGGGTSE